MATGNTEVSAPSETILRTGGGCPTSARRSQMGASANLQSRAPRTLPLYQGTTLELAEIL